MAAPIISTSKLQNPPSSSNLSHDLFFQSIQNFIINEKYHDAISYLLSGFASIKTQDDNYKLDLYKALCQLLPNFEARQFTSFLEDHLPVLLEQTPKHLAEQQRILAKQLAKWHIKHPQSDSLKDLLKASLEAMNYFAKAIQITEDSSQSSDDLHRSASKIFLRIMEKHLFGSDGNAFQYKLDSARRGGQSELNKFEKIYSQLEECKRFCRKDKDKKLIKDLFIQATRVFQHIKSGSLHQPFSVKFADALPKAALFPLPALCVTKNYSNALQRFRRHFKLTLHQTTDVQKLQADATVKFRELFRILLQDALIILGPPPCEYDIRGMGSFGREELCPFSDLEIFILIEKEDNEVRNYFETLVYLIGIQIVSLNETPNISPCDFTCVKRINPAGFRLDIGGDPAKDPKLIATPSALTMLQMDKKCELMTKNTLLKSQNLMLSTDSKLWDDYQTALKKIMLNLAKQRALTLFKLRMDDYEKQWKVPFQTKRGRLDLKKNYVELLNHLLSDMAIYFGIDKQMTRNIIDALINRRILSENSGQFLQKAINCIYLARISVHLFYGMQKEEVCYGDHANSESLYVLEAPVKEELEQIYWLALRPLYALLKKIVREGKPPEEIFKNVDLGFNAYFEGFDHLPSHTLKPLISHMSISWPGKWPNLEGRTLLHLATAAGDLDRTKKQVTLDKDLHKDTQGNTPLMLAACFNRREVFEYLLPFEGLDQKNNKGKGATDFAFDNEAYPILFVLLEKKQPLKIPSAFLTKFLKYICSKEEIAKDSVKKEVVESIINQIPKQDQETLMPLHIASVAGNYPILKTLLKLLPALINAQCKEDGNTPLHLALEAKSIPCALLLLEHGADPYIKNTKRLSSAHLAQRLQLWPVLRMVWFKNLVDPATLTDPIFLFPEVCKARGEKLEKFVKWLVSSKKNLAQLFPNGKTVLHYAQEHDIDDESIDLLIEAGAPLNMQDHFGKIPLHYGFNEKLLKLTEDVTISDYEGITSLHLACSLPDPDLADIKSLISKGAKLDALNKNGNTPLHLAIDRILGRDEELPLELLDQGANPDIANIWGFAPIVLAVENKLAKVAKALFQRIEDPKLAQRKTRLGSTLFELACSNEMFSLALSLLKRGADLDHLHPIYLQELCFYGLQQKDKSIWSILKKYRVEEFKFTTTPLHQALLAENEELARKLIKTKLYGNKRDHRGRLALHIAYEKGDMGRLVNRLPKTEDVKAVDCFGATPWHYAIRGRHEYYGEKLVEDGASLHAEDTAKRTPLEDMLALKSPIGFSRRPFVRYYIPKEILEANLTRESDWWQKVEDYLFYFTDQIFQEDLQLLHQFAGDWREFLSLYHEMYDSWRELKPYPKGWFKNLDQLYKDLSNGHYDILELFFGLGILSPSHKESEALIGFWRSPIIYKRLDLFKQLGFDLWSSDEDGNTPLHWACRYPHNIDTVRYLLENGADPNAANKKGETPLSVAKTCSAEENMIKLLYK